MDKASFINLKIKEIKELLEHFLPEKGNFYEFEEIYNQIKDLIA